MVSHAVVYVVRFLLCTCTVRSSRLRRPWPSEHVWYRRSVGSRWSVRRWSLLIASGPTSYVLDCCMIMRSSHRDSVSPSESLVCTLLTVSLLLKTFLLWTSVWRLCCGAILRSSDAPVWRTPLGLLPALARLRWTREICLFVLSSPSAQLAPTRNTGTRTRGKYLPSRGSPQRPTRTSKLLSTQWRTGPFLQG